MLLDGTAHTSPNVTVHPFTHPTLSELFHEFAQLTDDVPQIASSICGRLQLDRLQAAVLWPVILEQCRTIARNSTRRLEQATKPQRVGRAADPTGDRLRCMKETFTTGDGRRVYWGEATIADHQMRIDYLARMRDGIDNTVQRHREAIQQLKASGASCLNELLEATK